jgi:hypothetical protein
LELSDVVFREEDVRRRNCIYKEIICRILTFIGDVDSECIALEVGCGVIGKVQVEISEVGDL